MSARIDKHHVELSKLQIEVSMFETELRPRKSAQLRAASTPCKRWLDWSGVLVKIVTNQLNIY